MMDLVYIWYVSIILCRYKDLPTPTPVLDAGQGYGPGIYVSSAHLLWSSIFLYRIVIMLRVHCKNYIHRAILTSTPKHKAK